MIKNILLTFLFVVTAIVGVLGYLIFAPRYTYEKQGYIGANGKTSEFGYVVSVEPVKEEEPSKRYERMIGPYDISISINIDPEKKIVINHMAVLKDGKICYESNRVHEPDSINKKIQFIAYYDYIDLEYQDYMLEFDYQLYLGDKIVNETVKVPMIKDYYKEKYSEWDMALGI